MSIKTWLTTSANDSGDWGYHVQFSPQVFKTALDYEFMEKISGTISDAIAKDFLRHYRKDILKKLDRKAITNAAIVKIAKQIAQELQDEKK